VATLKRTADLKRETFFPALEHFQATWIPVRYQRKCNQTKESICERSGHKFASENAMKQRARVHFLIPKDRKMLKHRYNMLAL
jgi:hypothetical protein